MTPRKPIRPFLFALVALLAVVGVPGVASAAPTGPGSTHRAIGTNAILGQVARPSGSAIQPLHRLSGSVPVQPRTKAPLTAAGTAAAGRAAVAAPGVGLRALVIGVDSSDWGVATWTSTLDRVGAAYDVFYSRTGTFTSSSFLRTDGNGKYNAILLTSSSQLYDAGGGSFVSGLTSTEWNALWAYETTFSVRQAALYTSYGTWPEDYCLSASSEGGVTEPPVTASLTSAGAAVFDYLNPAAAVPIEESYVYRTRVTAGCAATPMLVSGDDVLAVQSTSSDGRQRMALTFTSNLNLNQAYLLVYGMVRWASRGMFLGDQRHYLNVDVDDWFNTSEERNTDGTINSDPGYQMSGHDAYNSYTQETSIRTTYPLASGFTYNMAFNGSDGDETAPSLCSPNSTSPDTLSGTTKCLKNNFHWLNHTFSHLALNFTDYPTTYSEINNNRVTANQFGLSQPNTVLKTGEYSGLGVYNPDPNDEVNPPTDHGLGASNPNLLSAAQTLGVRYLHGNMSFPSEVPSCFNCNIVHPLNNTLSVVPDWPTNIAFFSTTPDEETSFYNAVYGPGGTLAYFPTNQTYAQVVSNEANIGFAHVATGSVYTHTFHIGNLRDYGSGNTLASDWVRAVAGTYSSYYNVPLLNTTWTSLADYTKQRNAHFKARTDGIDAVYFPGTNTISVTAPAGIQETVMLTGTTAAGSTTYGTDHLATMTVNGGRTVSVPASPRP